MGDKKVAIMQPYIFPYLGYFQLIQAVDTFVFYDDVNFIKQGWINRNQILINNQPTLFTVPVKKISSFEEIRNTEINYQNYEKWCKKFLKSLEQNYRSTPFFKKVFPLVSEILNSKFGSISEMAISSVVKVNAYLGLKKAYCKSSDSFPQSKGLDKADRIVKICQDLNIHDYVNPAGGKELYTLDYFRKEGVQLYFINNSLPNYEQFRSDFASGLSIIDVLMFNDIHTINNMLKQYTLE